MYYSNNFNGKYWAIVGPKIVRTTQGSRLPGPHYRRTTVLLIQTVFFYLLKPSGYCRYSTNIQKFYILPTEYLYLL